MTPQVLRHSWGLLLAALLTALATVPGWAESYDDILQAVKVGDIATATQLLRSGMDINTVDADGNTLLILACREQNWAVAKALLGFRPKLDSRNRYGETALMLAAAKGSVDLVETLLERGAALNHPGWTALSYAAWAGQTGIVRLLLQRGAMINAESDNSTTPLMMAVRGGHLETVLILLEFGADINHKNSSGGSALGWAIDTGNTDIAELLIRAGAEE